MSQGTGKMRVTLSFQETKRLFSHVSLDRSNIKILWIKSWNIAGTFKDIWAFLDIMTSISIEYGLPFSALIDDGMFPESWLKVKIRAFCCL